MAALLKFDFHTASSAPARRRAPLVLVHSDGLPKSQRAHTCPSMHWTVGADGRLVAQWQSGAPAALSSVGA